MLNTLSQLTQAELQQTPAFEMKHQFFPGFAYFSIARFAFKVVAFDRTAKIGWSTFLGRQLALRG